MHQPFSEQQCLAHTPMLLRKVSRIDNPFNVCASHLADMGASQ